MKKLSGVLSLSIIVLLTAASISYSNTYEIIRLTDDNYIDAFPQINESSDVVWEGGGPLTSDKEIYFYDRSSGETTELTHTGYVDMQPKINANGVVVWYAYGAGDEYEIFLYDGSTIIQLTDNNYDDWGHQINAQGHVVWHGFGNGDPDDPTTDSEIFLYDGSTTIQLTDNNGDDYYPQINAQGHVVWHGFGNEDPDDPTTDSEIFLYDGSTTIQLTDNNGDDYYPQINAQGHVVWSGEDTYGNHQIFLYAGGTPTQLTFDTQGDNHGPQINANGDVVYTRKPYPLQIMTRIFLYDHSIGGAPFMLVPSDYGLSPQINAEGHVVWYNDYQYKDIQFYDGSAIIELTLDTTVRDWFPQINSNGDVV